MTSADGPGSADGASTADGGGTADVPEPPSELASETRHLAPARVWRQLAAAWRAGPWAARAARALPTVVAVLTAALVFPTTDAQPASGLEGSWQAALYMSDYGPAGSPDLVFPYGPLGFLDTPTLWRTPMYVLAVLMLFAVLAVFAFALLATLRRYTATWLAAVVTFFVTAMASDLMQIEDLTLAAGGMTAALLVTGPARSRRFWRLAAAAAACVASLEMLVKFSDGVLFTFLAVVLAFALGRRSLRERLAAAAAMAGAVVVLVVVWWSATGRNPLDLGRWLVGMTQITAGYSDAMGADPPEAWVLPAFAFLVAVLGFVVGLNARRGAPVAASPGTRGAQDEPANGTSLMSRRFEIPLVAVLGVVVAGATFVGFKESFIRHGGIRVCVVAGLFGLVAASRLGRSARVLGALLALAGLVVTLAATIPSPRRGQSLRPFGHASAFTSAVLDGLDSARRDAIVTAGRRQIAKQVGLDAQVRGAVGAATVHVDPVETTLVWRYGLNWQPAPVFQSYSAYTAYLDDLDADLLAGPHAPQYVLTPQTQVAIDTRVPQWESPRYELELTCRYWPAVSSGGWTALRRGADRCGATTSLGRWSLDRGATVAVPLPRTPGDLVVARFHLPTSVGQHLAALVYRNPPTTALVNGSPRRFVKATAGQPHLVRVPGGFNVETLSVLGVSHAWVEFDEISMS